MSDYIKREDAIHILACEMYAEAQSEGYDAESVEDYIPEATAWMSDAPSAEPPYQYSEAYVEQIRTERDILQDMVDNMAKPKTEMVLCALADRACPFQGQEYSWCLTCPHISEEDRALVKKAVAEPKAGCIPVSDVRKLQDIVWMHIGAMEGTRNIVEAGMLSAWKEVAEYVDGMLGEDGEA